MTENKKLADYLESYHLGEKNAISSRELEHVFQIRGSELRREVNSLRGADVPICSCDSGYYYAETEAELVHTIRQMQSRIKRIAFAERGLVRALEARMNTDQLRIPLDGGVTDE